ncbi:hypothetical protein [Paenibacillus sp. XY044]|uniref:hypothetical protein n=1 Tax=Paenibacillus sp. XY044 TaxID=2026089 RepID=UPI000B990549|nr:hypothetical protein [Paenibacillus sp. XY044]OZB90930.1 hypothetical protein CJP46_31460 [Paenibacillus sp. XY044]
MKKKITALLSSVVLLTAVATSASAESAEETAAPQDSGIFTPYVNTGWIKQNGIEARVYTDRTSSYPVSDTYIGITGEKKTAGSAYYQLTLDKKNGSTYSQVASTRGTFASSTGQWQVQIDDILSTGSTGTYRVMLKVFAYGDWDTWLGDWISDDFVVNN